LNGWFGGYPNDVLSIIGTGHGLEPTGKAKDKID